MREMEIKACLYGDKIPVLGIPILNRGDLLMRLVNSLDYLVAKLFIINNGSDEGVARALEKIKGGANPLIETVEIFSANKNLGVAASWNLIMAKNPEAPYWLIGSNDMFFQRAGDLKKIYEYLQFNYKTYAVIHAYAFNFFCVTKYGFGALGTFDENIYPAYLEDCDYSYRAQLAGAPRVNIPDINMKHGDGPSTGSLTIASSPKFAAANLITHQNNREYYLAKWGGPNGKEVYKRPFNNPRLPLNYWMFDMNRRKRQEAIWR